MNKKYTDNNRKNIHVDRDDIDVFLESEYSLVLEERLRRSQEQTAYIKLVLIGIATQFAFILVEVVGSAPATLVNTDPETLKLVLLMLSCGIVIATSIIFLFWLDHALTISAIDRFFKSKEEYLGVEGWYLFREKYSQNTFFKIFKKKLNIMKIKINCFRFSVFVSFLSPPTLFIILSLITEDLNEHRQWVLSVNLGLFFLFTCIILLGLALWKTSGSRLYFVEKVESDGDSK